MSSTRGHRRCVELVEEAPDDRTSGRADALSGRFVVAPKRDEKERRVDWVRTGILPATIAVKLDTHRSLPGLLSGSCFKRCKYSCNDSVSPRAPGPVAIIGE